MQKHSTVFIGLDVHKESVAIGVANAGRAAGRFVGTVGPAMSELLKAQTVYLAEGEKDVHTLEKGKRQE